MLPEEEGSQGWGPSLPCHWAARQQQVDPQDIQTLLSGEGLLGWQWEAGEWSGKELGCPPAQSDTWEGEKPSSKERSSQDGGAVTTTQLTPRPAAKPSRPQRWRCQSEPALSLPCPWSGCSLQSSSPSVWSMTFGHSQDLVCLPSGPSSLATSIPHTVGPAPHPLSESRTCQVGPALPGPAGMWLFCLNRLRHLRCPLEPLRRLSRSRLEGQSVNE